MTSLSEVAKKSSKKDFWDENKVKRDNSGRFTATGKYGEVGRFDRKKNREITQNRLNWSLRNAKTVGLSNRHALWLRSEQKRQAGLPLSVEDKLRIKDGPGGQGERFTDAIGGTVGSIVGAGFGAVAGAQSSGHKGRNLVLGGALGAIGGGVGLTALAHATAAAQNRQQRRQTMQRATGAKGFRMDGVLSPQEEVAVQALGVTALAAMYAAGPMLLAPKGTLKALKQPEVQAILRAKLVPKSSVRNTTVALKSNMTPLLHADQHAGTLGHYNIANWVRQQGGGAGMTDDAIRSAYSKATQQRVDLFRQHYPQLRSASPHSMDSDWYGFPGRGGSPRARTYRFEMARALGVEDQALRHYNVLPKPGGELTAFNGASPAAYIKDTKKVTHDFLQSVGITHLEVSRGVILPKTKMPKHKLKRDQWYRGDFQFAAADSWATNPVMTLDYAYNNIQGGGKTIKDVSVLFRNRVPIDRIYSIPGLGPGHGTEIVVLGGWHEGVEMVVFDPAKAKNVGRMTGVAGAKVINLHPHAQGVWNNNLTMPVGKAATWAQRARTKDRREASSHRNVAVVQGATAVPLTGLGAYAGKVIAHDIRTGYTPAASKVGGALALTAGGLYMGSRAAKHVQYARLLDQRAKNRRSRPLAKAATMTQMTNTERDKLVARKKRATHLSMIGGSLGLAALGARAPQALRAATAKAPKVQAHKVVSRIIRAEPKATNASNTLTTLGAGIGAAGSFNFANMQRQEAKQEAGGKFKKADDKFLRKHRARISTSAEKGYLHLKQGRDRQRGQAALSGTTALSTAAATAYLARKHPIAAGGGAVLTAANAANAWRNASGAHRWNSKMDKIKYRAETRAREGEWGRDRTQKEITENMAKALVIPKLPRLSYGVRSGGLVRLASGRTITRRGAIAGTGGLTR